MQKFKTSVAELRKRPPRNPAPFWSLLFFIFFLWKQRRLQVKEIQNTTRHTAVHTTSTTSFSVRFSVPRRQNKPLTREGNHHQQSNNGRTVGVPIQPKHEVSNLILKIIASGR